MASAPTGPHWRQEVRDQGDTTIGGILDPSQAGLG